MAGHKSPRIKDDKAKKRKREASECETKPKRHRHQRQQNQGNATELQKNLDCAAASQAAANDAETLAHHSSGYEAGWGISKPMGGRMLDIDPILTVDEQYLILIYTTSIQVYNASDSLLVRRIPICTLDASAAPGSRPATIVAARLSVENANFIWVACSDGAVYHVDWTVGAESSPRFWTASRTAKAMVVVPFPGDGKGDMTIIAESNSAHRMEVVAYYSQNGSAFKSKNIHLQALKNNAKDEKGLHLLEASQDGRILVGALLNYLLVCVASGAGADKLCQIEYNVYSFRAPDIMTAIDIRTHARPRSSKGRGGSCQEGYSNLVDVIAGGARGAIYMYRDVVSQVRAAAENAIQVNKLHWHRKAVHTVKWSRDGNYILSGGSENVVVIWQNDTSMKNFLPHLSGSVENIVVSASGSSYVVHLDDNSAMIISTAELQPTAYVSGIQSAVADVATPKDLLVKRRWTVADQVRRPVPAAINPKQPSKLHVCVGNGRQATMSGDFSAPLLQTFDLDTFTSVTKQALATTMPTHVNMTTEGQAIDEPLITHVVFSGDGQWLASVDERKPPQGDSDCGFDEQVIRGWHDVHLRFWSVAGGDERMELVARFNDPHATHQQETVLDVAANPATTGFATIGSEGIIRSWRPRTRKQAEAVIESATDGYAQSWGCSQLIVLGASSSRQLATDVAGGAAPKAQGRIAFSEDGSTLFAAFGVGDSGAVYVVDAASGEVVKILDDLWEGRLHAVSVLSSFLIILSDELRVFDVVSDELRYGIVVPQVTEVCELLQLAVDRCSGRFAVALPMGSYSTVGVFDPEDPEPLLVRSIPQRIVSLVSASSASGFVTLDDVAQIWVVAEGSDPSAVASSHALQDLRLDGPADAEGILVPEDAEMESDAESEEKLEEEEDVDMVEDDWAPKAVPRQYLADIFDAAPAFAAPIRCSATPLPVSVGTEKGPEGGPDEESDEEPKSGRVREGSRRGGGGFGDDAIYYDEYTGHFNPPLLTGHSCFVLYRAVMSFTSIPILDLDLARNPATKAGFLDELRHALIEVGFLYLKNVGISPRLWEAVVESGKAFFDVPLEEKLKIEMKNAPSFLGYSRLSAEITAGEADHREQLDLSTEHPLPKPGSPPYHNLLAPNQWPAEESAPGFRATYTEYMRRMGAMSTYFTSLIAEAIQLPADAFDKYFDLDQQHKLKIVKYPDLGELGRSGDGHGQGVGPHKDSMLTSYLLQATSHRGLQVQNVRGEWIDCPPIDGTLVVAIGQGMEALTQGVCVSTTHRVQSPAAGSGSRFSIPFFQGVSFDSDFEELETVGVGVVPEGVRAQRRAIVERNGGRLDDVEFTFRKGSAARTLGEATLRNRVKSHPDVGERWYPDIMKSIREEQAETKRAQKAEAVGGP
ncbi:hypothetical protein XA68_11114 [Ophiocordyceps unilateralis]|uniref:Fe2OG dioxygenase domain-containing protein n=1 Tax=Ophiocordyceps unilateralis TaxID=268505 RepID=A0A2A9PHH6_OPHUN|nr:hypothetical protein XA68_11114 [Ophiocordyceps unilateralis]